MGFVNMSELTYTEFEKFLQENNVISHDIRISLAGNGWGGPRFNLVLDGQKEDDNVTQIGDTKLLMKKSISDEFGVLTIKCGEENGTGGFSIEPENIGHGACSTCNSCS